MRIVIALFAVCTIAAACGKKINPVVTSELDLAILRDDGGIYENHSVRRSELQPDTGEVTAKPVKTPSAHDYNVHLRESRFKTRTESEVAIDLFESTSDRALVGRLIFKMMGKAISEYGTFRETCTLPDDPSPLSTCRIQSVILSKQETDPLGNKTRVFKHSSDNYTRDHQGVSYCEIALDAAHVKYRDAAYAGPAGQSSDETYKYALLSSQSSSDVQAPASLIVTCFKNVAKDRAKAEYRSVFRGSFQQTRVN